jgi:virginiamycin B lyase
MARLESPRRRPADLRRVRGQHKDIVWLSDFGANTTLRFDPKTEQFTVLKSTNRNASVRQVLGRPGEVWLPESGADKMVVIRE